MELMKKLTAAVMAAAVMSAAVPVNTVALVNDDITFDKAIVSIEGASFDTVESAALYVRECFKKKMSEFTIAMPAELGVEAFYDVVLKAVEETDNADEGDYMKYGIYRIYCAGDFDGKNYYFEFDMTYNATAQQEDYVDERVEEILASLELEKLDDYGKISAIYEYIISNVEYDYSMDTENKEKFSAYGALHNGIAVCQGFSQLFYRLIKEAGLPCRIISGESPAGAHAWNIVAIDNIYYLGDTTWDSCFEEVSDCVYFLKGSLDFDDVERDKIHMISNMDHHDFMITDFTSTEFKAEYPISDYAYKLSDGKDDFTLGDVNVDGFVDSIDASLILNGYANLSIHGVSRMGASQERAADVNSDDLIDASDASTVLAYYSHISTGGTDSFEKFIEKVK